MHHHLDAYPTGRNKSLNTRVTEYCNVEDDDISCAQVLVSVSVSVSVFISSVSTSALDSLIDRHERFALELWDKIVYSL